MKVLVVSQQPAAFALAEQVQLLATIKIEPSRAIPVVAVNDFHNMKELSQAAGAEGEAVQFDRFTFDDMRCENSSSLDDHYPIDGNRLAKHLNASKAPWIIFDLEQHQPATCEEFITKLSRYSFLASGLTGRTVVLLVPAAYLALYSRKCNQAMNNIPVGSIEISRSGDTSLLLLSAGMERWMLSVPLLTAPLRRLSRLMMFLYQRLVKPA